MTQGRRYSETDLRALLEPFEVPMLVVRDGRLWAVNRAMQRLAGAGQEQLEGRTFLDLLAPEERSLQAELYRRHREEDRPPGPLPPRRHLLLLPAGARREVATSAQELELEEGGRALLMVCTPLGEVLEQPELSEQLAQMSSRLVAAHSEEMVRREAVEGLATAGLSGRFLYREGGRLVCLDGAPPPEDLALGLEALARGRPVFGGSLEAGEGGGPVHVYLPLGTTRPEVLRVEGRGLSPSHGTMLALFARVIGAALMDAYLLADVERGRWEMGAVAEVARLIAWPQPPTPEDFLARLGSLIAAEAAALYALESLEGTPVLMAQVGMEVRLREALARLGPEGLVESAAAAHGPLAASEEQAQALRAASGGRFGSGAAVRLAYGGRLRGVLVVLRSQRRPFSGGDLRLLSTLAELLGALLEQHRLRAEPPRQLSEPRQLQDQARSTATTLETTGILSLAADFFARLLDVSNCFVFLYDKQAQDLRCTAAAFRRGTLRGLDLPLDGDSLAARVARERRPAAVEDVRKAGREDTELMRLCGAEALLGLPLYFRDELVGVVLACEARQPRTFPPALVDLALATCSQIALALDNARLYESLLSSYAELAATRAEMVKRERLAALGELSAAVAHEVRNPLGVIFNAVSALRRMLRPDGDAALLLDIVLQESDRLNRLVSNLLDYTRPREPLLQPEPLQPVLQEAFEAARAQHPEGPLPSLSLELERGLPPVPMDRQLMNRALLNVLLNALQAMPQGGELAVHARREVRGGRELMRIDVTDRGPGISKELLQRVFEPFFTTKAQGTGLGLAVVKRILELHRGEVTVDSVPGHGTTFTFLLPLSPSMSLS